MTANSVRKDPSDQIAGPNGLTPLGLPSLCLLRLPSLGLLVILPLTPFGLLLVYPISLSMASWILGYGFMITCSVMPYISVLFILFQYV